MDPQRITAEAYVERLTTLLGRGVPIPLLPRRIADRRILLHQIARGFDSDREYDEKETTGRIGRWLAGPGSPVGLDSVSLRRALVDEGFLERDRAGRRYRASRNYERFVRFELAGVDLAALDVELAERAGRRGA